MLFVPACSSGYSDEEVEATANAAYRAGQEAGSYPQRVFLEVTKLEAWDGTGGQCPSLISLEGCGLVQWADGARSARIIYVDQKITVGFTQDRIDEFNFAHFCAGRAVIRSVFDRDPTLKNVLRPADPLRYILYRRISERYRHQIIQMTVIAAVT